MVDICKNSYCYELEKCDVIIIIYAIEVLLSTIDTKLLFVPIWWRSSEGLSRCLFIITEKRDKKERGYRGALQYLCINICHCLCKHQSTSGTPTHKTYIKWVDGRRFARNGDMFPLTLTLQLSNWLFATSVYVSLLMGLWAHMTAQLLMVLILDGTCDMDKCKMCCRKVVEGQRLNRESTRKVLSQGSM